MGRYGGVSWIGEIEGLWILLANIASLRVVIYHLRRTSGSTQGLSAVQLSCRRLFDFEHGI